MISLHLFVNMNSRDFLHCLEKRPEVFLLELTRQSSVLPKALPGLLKEASF